MSEQEEETQIKKLDGISSATVKKLKEIGVTTLRELSIQIPGELAQKANMSIDTTEKYIAKAIMELYPVYTSARADLEKRKLIQRCTTGSTSLDTLLGDGLGNIGLETGAITEVYGEFGSGKSQICHTLCVTAQLPLEEKGFDTNVVYIDTEGTFRSERVYKIATARGLDPDKILDRIAIFKPRNAAHLELMVDDIFKYLQELKARLLIIDSIIALHRAEGSDRAHLAARQQSLGKILNKLIKTAETFSVATVVTNQVSSSPDPFHPQQIATGGNIIAHHTTYRIALRKTGSKDRSGAMLRVARMVDSPSHETNEVRFAVTERGVDDITE